MTHIAPPSQACRAPLGAIPHAFTRAEIARFVERFEASDAWTTWRHRTGADGADVIEVVVADRRRTVLRFAKVGPCAFVASGFGGWSLAVCERFADLLEATAPAERQFA